MSTTPNPYSSPNPIVDDEAPQVVRKSPPLAGIIFGVLHILYGLSMLLCNGISGLVFVVKLPAEMVEGNAGMDAMANPFFRLYSQCGIVASMISGVIFIVAGVGLLRLRPFGRRLSIWVALLEYFLLLLSVVLNGIYLLPLLLKQINTLPSGTPEQMGALIALISVSIGVVFSALYPTLVLFCMTRPKMVAAYAPAND